jgi:hypothetical protein
MGCRVIAHLALSMITLAAERFQHQRVYVGRLVAHGPAQYENKPDEKANYYVTLKTINGEKTIWGVDLERTMSASDIKENDDLAILYKGKNRVTVKVNERDAEGKPTGKKIDADVSRNTWEVNKLDKMREEVQLRLRDAVRHSGGAQPVVRVYDVAADRKPAAASDPVKQRDQEQSPSR